MGNDEEEPFAVISGPCIQLCDPNINTARNACTELVSILSAARHLCTSGFEHVLAPAVFQLAERPPQWGLLEEVCRLVQLLLAQAEPRDLPGKKALNVFPLLCERACGLLETVFSGGRRGSDSVEIVTVQLLQILQILLRKWYVQASGRSELSRMQVGFVAHLAVRLLSEDGVSREQQLLSLELLQAVTEVERSIDNLASFYPGVCTALARVLLRHGSHAKAGSKVIIASCGCFSAWLQAVLSNERNLHLLDTESDSTALELAFSSGSVAQGLARIFSMHTRTGKTSTESPPFKNRAAQHAGLPDLKRDKTWLDETSKRTSQVFLAVLRGSCSTDTLWLEKSLVRQAFLDLSISAIRGCSKTLTSDAVEACFELVFASLSETEETEAKTSRLFLQESLESEQAWLVQSRLEDWLIKLFCELAPEVPGRSMVDVEFVPKRLARLDGLLQFLEVVFVKGSFTWTESCMQRLRGPILRACELNAGGMHQLLQDQGSLSSLPDSATAHMGSFVKLFPYDVKDLCDPDAVDRAPASACHSDGLESCELKDSSGLPKELIQVKMWLLRALHLTGGNEDLAHRLKYMLVRLAKVLNVETLFTSIFEASSSWQEAPSTSADLDLADLSDSGLKNSTAAMFALAAFLDAQSGVTGSRGQDEFIQIPPWLVSNSLKIALLARTACRPQASDEVVLHVLCAHQLMTSALQRLKYQDRRQVQRQVRHLLKPLLEDLGAGYFAISLASRGTLLLLHQLISTASIQTAGSEVSSLLEEYSDHLVGDICFQLRFEISDLDSTEDSCNRKLPLLLSAVVQHASLEMAPFFADVVHTLMTGAFAKFKGRKGSIGSETFAKPAWVLHCLAGIVQRLALLICQERFRRFAASGAKLQERARDQHAESSAVAAFFSGSQRTWKISTRQDGFLLNDLGQLLDEDACKASAIESAESDEEGQLDRCGEASPSYAAQRRVASSIVMWARHELQSSSARSRHLAHMAVVHGLTVLSTRVRDLLPHVHDIWQQLVPSFTQEVSLAAQVDACVLLKHVARLSGDFIQRRFVDDCWGSLWLRLSSVSAVTQAAASPACPELKMQYAALDALAFISGDSLLVQHITKQMLALAIKFLGRSVAEKLRKLAWVLMEHMVVVDPDLAWLFLQDKPSPMQAGADWQGVLLLKEVGAEALQDDDRERLQALVLREDSKPWCPRVGLGVGGDLWSSFLQGESQCGPSDARSESGQSE